MYWKAKAWVPSTIGFRLSRNIFSQTIKRYQVP